MKVIYIASYYITILMVLRLPIVCSCCNEIIGSEFYYVHFKCSDCNEPIKFKSSFSIRCASCNDKYVEKNVNIMYCKNCSRYCNVDIDGNYICSSDDPAYVKNIEYLVSCGYTRCKCGDYIHPNNIANHNKTCSHYSIRCD